MPQSQKKHITLVWELGGGLGHLYRLHTIGSALYERGFEISYILPFHAQALGAMQDEAKKIVVAPIKHTPNALAFSNRLNFSETLCNFSYSHSETFIALSKEWEFCIDDLGPDLIITDYAPTAVFMAHCLSIPCVMIGSGFSSPAIAKPMPVYANVTHDVDVARFLKVEESVVQVLNDVNKRYDKKSFDSVGDIFSQVNHTYLCVDPSLDHYPNRRLSNKQSYIGPIGNLINTPYVGSEIDTLFESAEKQNQKVVLIYLNKNYSHLRQVFAQLSGKPIHVLAYCKEIDPLIKNYYSNTSTLFTEQALNLSEIVSRVDVLIHHGGINLSHLGMMQTKPQCLLPRYDEQTMTAKNLETQNLAKLLWQNGPDKNLYRLVTEVLENVQIEKHLKEKQLYFRNYTEADSVNKLIESLNMTS